MFLNLPFSTCAISNCAFSYKKEYDKETCEKYCSFKFIFCWKHKTKCTTTRVSVEICQNCLNGFVLIEDKNICVNSIKGCESYSLSNYLCEKCNDYYFLYKNNHLCYDKIPNCLKHDIDNENNIICKECSKDYLVIFNGCYEGIKNCIGYNKNDDKLICVNCKSGFVVYSNKCIPKIENCFKYSSSFLCEKCADGYIIFETNNYYINENISQTNYIHQECIKSIPNCELYSRNSDKNISICLKCKNEYNLQYNECFENNLENSVYIYIKIGNHFLSFSLESNINEEFIKKYLFSLINFLKNTNYYYYDLNFENSDSIKIINNEDLYNNYLNNFKTKEVNQGDFIYFPEKKRLSVVHTDYNETNFFIPIGKMSNSILNSLTNFSSSYKYLYKDDESYCQSCLINKGIKTVDFNNSKIVLFSRTSTKLMFVPNIYINYYLIETCSLIEDNLSVLCDLKSYINKMNNYSEYSIYEKCEGCESQLFTGLKVKFKFEMKIAKNQNDDDEKKNYSSFGFYLCSNSLILLLFFALIV